MKFILSMIIVFCLLPTFSCNKRQKLTVSIILPKDLFRERDFNTCIAQEVRAINNLNLNFTSNFYLESNTIHMERNYNDIIDTVCMILKTQSNAAIFINYNDYSSTEALNSKLFLRFISDFNIPVMAFIPNAYQTNHLRDNEIQLSTTLYHQAEAIMGLLSRYEWNKYSIIITDASGSEEFLHAAESLQYSGNEIKQFEILSVVKIKIKKNDKNSRAELRRKLNSIKLETRVFLLHCDFSETNEIFAAADAVGMTTHEYMWILTRSVIEKQFSSNYHYKNFPIGSLGLFYNTSADWACKSVLSDSLKIWANAVDRYFNLNYRKIKTSNSLAILPNTKCWTEDELRFSSNVTYQYGREFHSLLLNATVSANRQIKFTKTGILDSVDLRIVNLNANYIWKPVGSWTNKTLLMDDIVWPGKAHKPPIGRPIRFHLKIVTLEEPPFVIYKEPALDGTCLQNSVKVQITDKAENKTKCASGFYIDILIMLKDRLEFTFDMYQVEDGKWGANVSNTWNGLIGDVVNGKADMVMTSLKITRERSQVIDFSVPFMETGIAIVVALRPGAISTTAFLKPYDYIIWIMILLVILHSVAISVFLFEWITNKLGYTGLINQKGFYRFKFIKNIDEPKSSDLATQNKKSDQNDYKFFTLEAQKEPKFTFGHSLWLIWVLLFRAATKVIQPSGFTSKFMSNVWACFCMAFMASYTANLAAFMITKEEYYDLNGIEDDRLIRPLNYNPSLRYGTVKHGSTEEVIKNNYASMHKYMEKYMKANISEGINAVKKHIIDAFMYDAVVLDYRSGQDENCTLRVVGNWYSMTGYGIAFPKGSKYKEMIDRKILEYSHSGELERSQRFWFSGVCKTKFNDDDGRGSHPLDVLNFTSAFILLAGGILIATLLLITDHVYHAFFHKKVKRIWVYKSNQSKTKSMSKRSGSRHDSSIRKNISNQSLNKLISLNLNSCSSKCDNPDCFKKIKKLENELKALTIVCNEYNLIKSKENSQYTIDSGDKPFAAAAQTAEQTVKFELKCEIEDNNQIENSQKKQYFKLSSNKYSKQNPINQFDCNEQMNLINELKDQLDYFNKKRLELETAL